MAAVRFAAREYIRDMAPVEGSGNGQWEGPSMRMPSKNIGSKSGDYERAVKADRRSKEEKEGRPPHPKGDFDEDRPDRRRIREEKRRPRLREHDIEGNRHNGRSKSADQIIRRLENSFLDGRNKTSVGERYQSTNRKSYGNGRRLAEYRQDHEGDDITFRTET